MKSFLFISPILALLAFTGCASNPAIEAKKAGIHTVTVEPRVDMRRGMRYGYTPSSGGGLAGMIVNGAGQKGVARMSNVMAEHQINVPDLVRERFTEYLRGDKDFQLAETEADGVFIATILQYGFDMPGLKMSTKCPVIQLQVELRSRAGKKIWIAQSSISQLTEKDIGASYDEYEAHPEKLRADWIKQIDYLVTHLMKNIGPGYYSTPKPKAPHGGS